MTPENYVLKALGLPQLIVTDIKKISNITYKYFCQKSTSWEVCRKCPTKSFQVHDKRTVTIRDAKIRNKNIKIEILKRRFRCPNCKSVFTETIPGIKHRHRTTEKYRDEILFNFKYYNNIKSVARINRCSEALVYKICYQRLELELRKSRNTPWSSTVCIDEHSFKRNTKKTYREFVTAFVDNKRKCLRELAYGVSHDHLEAAISHIPGRENVTHVVMDMTNNYKKFVLDYFPNAKIVADKFHVLRLFYPIITKYRKEVTGDHRKNPIRNLLLKNRNKLSYIQRSAVKRFCNENPLIGEVYRYKERISHFYRIKGFNQARRIFISITDDLAGTEIPELKRLRNTLMKWRDEILRYFKTGLTNARVEGFNRKCKLIQRLAYSYRSFENYRLRALYLCR